MTARWRCVGLLAVSLAGCMGDAGGQIAPVAVAGARPAPAALPGSLTLPAGPAGAGPHPVVILLHGCAGVSANTRLWANRVVAWGFGALVLDSFTPRGLTTVCAPAAQRLVTRFDRAGDVVAAVQWLRLQPGVDAQRLAVLGESHGGGTAATVVLHPYADAMGGALKGAVDYYGPCRTPADYAGTPMLVLAGSKDTWSDPARTCEAFGAALPPGSPFSIAVYPGAVHGFDNPRLVTPRTIEGHPMAYDAEAAADSVAKVHAFLDRVIGPAG